MVRLTTLYSQRHSLARRAISNEAQSISTSDPLIQLNLHLLHLHQARHSSLRLFYPLRGTAAPLPIIFQQLRLTAVLWLA